MPGTITTGAVDVSSATGSGNRLYLSAAPGTVLIQLSAPSPYLFKCDNVPDLAIQGIVFDGNNQNLTQTVGSVGAGLVRITGSLSTNAQFSNCSIVRSSQSGLLLDAGAVVSYSGCQVSTCNVGITSLDSQISARVSRIFSCGNNGVFITRSTPTGDNSVVESCLISDISNNSGGTGQYGNGVAVYKAAGVRVSGNAINNCSFSAFRVNGGANSQIIGNNIYNAREDAIYLEAPDLGLNTEGGLVANNLVNTAGVGISIANLALNNDGFTRRVTVIGNQIFNILQNSIPPPYVPSKTYGVGIIVTGYTTVTGNNIESAATSGIILGTNNAAIDLTCTGNYVTQCPMGIGYSANPSAGNMVIAGNLISQFRTVATPGGTGYGFSGAIVSAVFDGATYNRATNGSLANTDYGNANDQLVGNLKVGNNRAS